jgi:hypothetical protein
LKILLGDFNAIGGSQDIFKPTIGNESSHKISNDNGVIEVDSAKSKNFVVKSTIFLQHDINKYVWNSPEGKMCNQIYHVLIDRKTALKCT